MENILGELKKAMSKWKMKLHWGKTTVMVVGKQPGKCVI